MYTNIVYVEIKLYICISNNQNRTPRWPKANRCLNKMTTSSNSPENKTIVYFHTGRGGHFNNAGHRTFQGTKNISEVLSLCDSSNQWSFRRDRDEKGRFCAPYYADQNGNYIISEKELETGVGQLEWDANYDTDTCFLLSECDESDLMLILESNEWNKENVLVEFFNECTDLVIDWRKFNGDYEALIHDYFNFTISVEDFYNEKETEE